MAIVLQEQMYTPRVVKYGNATFAVVAGQRLKIETTPAGEEILNVECPAGKVWNVIRVIVEITETDA